MQRPYRDSRQQLTASIEQIEDNASLFRKGRNSAYQSVAVQLRKLLLNGRRALLPRVIPDPTFHQFAGAVPLEPPAPGLVPVVLLGRVRLGGMTQGHAAYFELDLDKNLPPVPLQEWLTEWIVRPDTVLPNGTQIKGFRIDKLIREAANEEAAHAEDIRGPTLARMDGRVEVSGVITRKEHEMAIVAIGEYVATRVREMLR